MLETKVAHASIAVIEKLHYHSVNLNNNTILILIIKRDGISM